MVEPLINADPRPAITLITAIVQIGATYTATMLIHEKLYGWLLIPAALQISTIIIPIYILPKFLRWRDTPAIETFLRMMRDPVASAAPQDDVRCSIFRPSLFKKRLIEVVLLTAEGLERRKNKYMTVHQGTAGRAYRSKLTIYIPIQAGNWATRLMHDLGFTQQELSRFRPDRGSYLSVPVLKRTGGQAEEVVAVVSFDSNSNATFTPAMIEEIERTAAYIALVI
jgi:hypothetical protein